MHGRGKITRVYEAAIPDRSMCKGCRDDFYNGRTNFSGKEGCWSFDLAKVVDKIGYRSLSSVSMDETMVKTLSCWHAVCK